MQLHAFVCVNSIPHSPPQPSTKLQLILQYHVTGCLAFSLELPRKALALPQLGRTEPRAGRPIHSKFHGHRRLRYCTLGTVQHKWFPHGAHTLGSYDPVVAGIKPVTGQVESQSDFTLPAENLLCREARKVAELMARGGGSCSLRQVTICLSRLMHSTSGRRSCSRRQASDQLPELELSFSPLRLSHAMTTEVHRSEANDSTAFMSRKISLSSSGRAFTALLW